MKMIPLIFLVLCGCQTMLKDVPLCVELSPITGACVNIISGKEAIIDDFNTLEGKTWWEMRPAMIQMPASTWRHLKTYIIENCKRTGQCDAQITNWERSINILDDRISEKLQTP